MLGQRTVASGAANQSFGRVDYYCTLWRDNHQHIEQVLIALDPVPT